MPHPRDINDVERLATMVAECYSEGLILSLQSSRQYLDVQLNGEAGVCGIVPMLCSFAIVSGMTESGYVNRWCYRGYREAQAALAAWDGTGEPLDWYRHPSSGRTNYDKY